MSNAKVTKAQLQQRLNDVEGDNEELFQINQRMMTKLKGYDTVLHKIMAIHQPHVDTSRLLPADGFAPTIVLRCNVCQTPEHHTWAEDNYEMWPCPTLRGFVNTSDSPIEVSSGE